MGLRTCAARPVRFGRWVVAGGKKDRGAPLSLMVGRMKGDGDGEEEARHLRESSLADASRGMPRAWLQVWMRREECRRQYSTWF